MCCSSKVRGAFWYRSPALIVAPNRLGTINHCALTARVAAGAGLAVRGFVLSQPSHETDRSGATNAETIAALTGLPVLAILPHCTAPEDVAALLADVWV